MKATTCIFAISLAASLVNSRGQDVWTEKTSFAGAKRIFATGFSIDGKGYLGTGLLGDYTHFNDLWKYNPVTDAWTQKASLPGSARRNAVGFAIGNKG